MRDFRFRTLLLLLSLSVFCAFAVGCSDGDDGNDGPPGPTGPPGPPGDPVGVPVTSVETCVSCHGSGGVAPVGDIASVTDAHAIDGDPDGPLTASGYRRVDATLTEVDVTGSSVVIEFDALDETGAGVDDLRPQDGRFAIDRLDPALDGDPSQWIGIGTRSTENFTSGTFENLAGGFYRYTSAYDPTGRVVDGDSLRVAIQLSASDLPAENAWCDFDADLTTPNDCVSGTTLTRDIVQTADCNVCHGPTSETKLSFHGGGRTDVEYCVACHNPSGNTDFTLLVHKIHAGETLENGFRTYSNVRFTRDLDDCVSCHTGGGADVDNWRTQPNRVACGSCHDDVNFDTGENHGAGGVQMNNRFCANCHPPDGPVTTARLPVATVHLGGARTAEAETYRGLGNGYAIENLVYDASADEVTVVYSVGKDGSRMDLETAPEWTNGGSLALRAGWDTVEYVNTGSGSAPAQPTRINALDIGGAVSLLPGNRYEAVFEPPSGASNTITVHLEGRPVADLLATGSYSERIPVASAIASVDIEGGRSTTQPRRVIVDPTLCARCHDSGGAGLSAHGSSRVGETAACSVCHNAYATDINRRPADPMTTPDGKREESIDFKRLIHQIHAGDTLTNGVVVYGFGGSPNDYGSVGFIGNLTNCETCHVPDSYSSEAARAAAPTTIDTGADVSDAGDDLNISSTTSVCASCHDTAAATDHMLLHGASFEALEADIR